MKAFVASWIDSVLGGFPAYRRWRLGLWVWTPGVPWPKWTRMPSVGPRPGRYFGNGVWMEGY